MSPDFLTVPRPKDCLASRFLWWFHETLPPLCTSLVTLCPPAQGAIVLARAFGCDDLEAVRCEILHRLYRQPPLRTLSRQGLPNALSRLTIELWTPRVREAKVESWYVCCDTRLFPGANCEPLEIANIVGLLPFGKSCSNCTCRGISYGPTPDG